MLVFPERKSSLRRRNRTMTVPVGQVVDFDARAEVAWFRWLPGDRVVKNRYCVRRRLPAFLCQFEFFLPPDDPVARAAQHRCSFAGSLLPVSPMMLRAQARGKALARAARGRPE